MHELAFAQIASLRYNRNTKIFAKKEKVEKLRRFILQTVLQIRGKNMWLMLLNMVSMSFCNWEVNMV